MERWLQATRTAVLGLVLPALLTSCGGGGGGTIQIFFGSNGDGSCDSIVVEVDLEAAGAVLARRDDQSADCALDALLDTAGCEIDVEEDDGGDTLRVTIDDCTIPPVAALFACGFSQADLSEFGDVTEAECDCESSGCDQSPPVCVSGDDDPRSCEDCDNGQDDDLNGLEDCDDPNCEHSAACGAPPTTTTLPETTTTTVPETTTTTTLAATDCEITFRLEDDVTLGSLEWLVDYADSDGSFVNTGELVECQELVEDTIAAFNERSEEETLELGLITVEGIDGPTDVVRCNWRGEGPPASEDFSIVELEAATVDLVVLPDPEIGVVVDCDGTPPTTTTTTVEPVTTTTTTDQVNFHVVFKLTESSVPLGALQLLIDYDSAPGDFAGQGAVVQCANLTEALSARNDDDADRELSLGFVSVDGFSAPADLSRCTFVGTEPVAGNFTIAIQDVTGIEGEAATATVIAEVSEAP
jgi:hypothetical protein